MSLSPASRALLDAAREGLAPDAAALRRVRMKVDTTIASGAGGAVIAKLAIVLGVAAIVAAGIGLRSSRDATTPTLAFASTSAVEVRVERVHDDPPPADIEMPVQSAVRPAPVVAIVDKPAAPPEPTIGLAREVELVDAAMAALRKGDASTAITFVRQHRGETHDRGQLAEDAAAIEIEALCRLRDHKVVAKLEAFDARWPESAQRSRLTTTCP